MQFVSHDKLHKRFGIPKLKRYKEKGLNDKANFYQACCIMFQFCPF